MNAPVSQPAPRSWRDIPQEVTTRAMSKSGKRRYTLGWLKVAAGCLFVVVCGWLAIDLVATIEHNPRELAMATKVGPVRTKPEFKTDGVLTEEWVVRTLGLSPRATLMELDLDRLQARLLASGQVRVAMLAKRFPDTLGVTLSERLPVARLQLREARGEPRTAFVARDGVVFDPEGYSQALVSSLPWLDGVRLVRRAGRLAPIEGMELLNDLITKARYESEHLASLFQVVDLSRLAKDGEIEVRSPECEGIVFSTRSEFFKQLAYLDYIRDTMRPSEDSPLARIDLSLGGTVPVSFKAVIPASLRDTSRSDRKAPPAPASRSEPRTDSFIQPNFGLPPSTAGIPARKSLPREL